MIWLTLLLINTGLSAETVKEKLERALAIPTARSSPQKDINFVATDKRREAWFKALTSDNYGDAVLTQKDVDAIKKFIEVANCVHSSDHPKFEKAEPTMWKIAEPDCEDGKGASEQYLDICTARVQCSMPGMTATFIAKCLTENGACPDPKACALQSHWDIKVTENDKTVYRSMWIGGSGVRQIK